MAAECGDGWMPVVTDWLQFEAGYAEPHRLCAAAGRAANPKEIKSDTARQRADVMRSSP